MTVIMWAEKLAKRLLWTTAQDMRPEHSHWLETEACQNLCAQAKIDHTEFQEAMQYMLGRSDIQRGILLQNLKKNIGA